MTNNIYFDRRVQRLEDVQGRKSAHVADPSHYSFMIACSCPPDLRLHMRGGLIYEYRDSGDGWFVDATTIDLTDSTQAGGETFTFTNADYYKGYYMRLQNGGVSTPYVFSFGGSGTEFATSGEAEQDLITHTETTAAWSAHYPLCGLVLRNDGNTGVAAAILPIDAINRGRSYTWPRDWRPRNIAL